MGMYDNVAAAEVYESAPFLGIGNYIVVIESAYGKEGRKNNFCQINMEIIKVLPEQNGNVPVHKVGDKVQMVFSKKSDYFDISLKKFCMAAGANKDDVDSKMCADLLPFWDEKKMKEPPVSLIEGFPMEWNGYREQYTVKQTGEKKEITKVDPIKVPSAALLEDLGLVEEINEEIFLDIKDADSADPRDCFWLYPAE